MERLDTAAAIPTGAGAVSGIGPRSRTLMASHPKETDEGGHEPEDGGDERERHHGLETTTLVAVGYQVAPVKNIATVIAEELFKCELDALSDLE